MKKLENIFESKEHLDIISNKHTDSLENESQMTHLKLDNVTMPLKKHKREKKQKLNLEFE